MVPVALAFPFSYTTHPAFIPPTFNTPGVAYSANVLINGLPVHRIGDVSEVHCIPIIPSICDVETFVTGGYPKVLVNGMPIALTCPVSAPGACIATWSSHTVLVGPPGIPLTQVTV